MDETRYFFAATGKYIGGFYGAMALVLVPPDAIEVPDPPNHGWDRMNVKTREIIPFDLALLPPTQSEIIEALLADKAGDSAKLEAVMAKRETAQAVEAQRD
jgi:hypothetical protein